METGLTTDIVFHQNKDQESGDSDQNCESPDAKEVQVKKKKKGPKQQLIMCTKECRYNVIKRVCRKMDIKLDPDENSDWDIWWSDTGV